MKISPIFCDRLPIITTAKGTPRMINTIALKAMIFTAQNKMTTVDQECVLKVLDELGLK